MRTTIELRDDLRGALLQLAAERGEKGFSKLVGEAIEAYLEAEKRRVEARTRALRARGALSRKDAEALRRAVAEMREEWR